MGGDDCLFQWASRSTNPEYVLIQSGRASAPSEFQSDIGSIRDSYEPDFAISARPPQGKWQRRSLRTKDKIWFKAAESSGCSETLSGDRRLQEVKKKTRIQISMKRHQKWWDNA